MSKSSFRPASSSSSPFVVPEYPAQSDSAEYFGLVLGRVVSRQAVPAQSDTQLMMRPFAAPMLEVLSHKVVQMPQPDRHELVQAPAPRRLDPPLQLCVAQEGEVASPTFVLRDNDSKFGGGFDAELAMQGIQAERLPISGPCLCNAHTERWNQPLRRGCLDHFVPVGLKHLNHLVAEYLEHYHSERPHQGLGNRLLIGHDPPDDRGEGEVVCHPRLGGVLRHYEGRQAA